MKRIVFFLLLPLIAQPVIAQEITSSSEFLLRAAFPPALKLSFIQRYKIPFLQGEEPLTQDNNICLVLTAEISPISIDTATEAIWTPVAFFQFITGGTIGSGWNIKLFGNDMYGIGINRSDAESKPEHSGNSFGGLLWKAQIGAALQADLAAVFPGEWNHVVARSYHEINYRGYTAAAKGESWYYENDSGYQGENCNGYNYYGNLLIGYKMPIFLNMVALLAEADLYLYDTPGRAKWGDDIIRWTYSLILNFTVTKNIDIAVLTQFWTRRNFIEPNWKDLYYRNRTVNTSNPTHLEFYRIGIAMIYRL